MVVTDAKSGEEEAAPASGSLWLGKEVTPRRGHRSVRHIVGGASEWTPQQAPSFPPHAESALRRRGRDRAPFAHLGVRLVPWHLPGSLRPAAGWDSCPSEMAWVGVVQPREAVSMPEVLCTLSLLSGQ